MLEKINKTELSDLSIPLGIAFTPSKQFISPQFKFTVKKLVKIRKENQHYLKFDPEMTVEYILFVGTTTGEIITFIIYSKNFKYEIKLFTIIDISKHKINSITESSDYICIQTVTSLSNDGSISIISVLDQIVLAHYPAQYVFNSFGLCCTYISEFSFLSIEDSYRIAINSINSDQTLGTLGPFVPMITNIQDSHPYFVVYQEKGNFSILTFNSDQLSMLYYYTASEQNKKVIVSPEVSFFAVYDSKNWKISDGYQILYEKTEENNIIDVYWITNTVFCVHTSKTTFKFKIISNNIYKLFETAKSNSKIQLELIVGNRVTDFRYESSKNPTKFYNDIKIEKISELEIEYNDCCYDNDLTVYINNDNLLKLYINTEKVSEESISDHFKGNIVSLHMCEDDIVTIDNEYNILKNDKKISNIQDSYRIIADINMMLVFTKSNKIFNINDNLVYLPFTEKIRWVIRPYDDKFFVFVTSKSFCLFDQDQIIGSQSFSVEIIDAFFIEDFLIITLIYGDCLAINRYCEIVSKQYNYKELKRSKIRNGMRFIEFPGFSTVATIMDSKTFDPKFYKKYEKDLILYGAKCKITIPMLDNFDIYNFTPLVSTQHYVLSLINNQDFKTTPSLFYLAVFASTADKKVSDIIYSSLPTIFQHLEPEFIFDQIENIRKTYNNQDTLITFLFYFIYVFPKSVKLIPKLYNELIYKNCLSDLQKLLKISICFDHINALIDTQEFLVAVHTTFLEKALPFMKIVKDHYIKMCFKIKDGVKCLVSFIKFLENDESHLIVEVLFSICSQKEKNYKEVVKKLSDQFPYMCLHNDSVFICEKCGKITQILITPAKRIDLETNFVTNMISINSQGSWLLLANPAAAMFIPLQEPMKSSIGISQFEISGNEEVPLSASWDKDSVKVSSARGKITSISIPK